MYRPFVNNTRLWNLPKFIHLTRNVRNQAFSCCRNSSLRKTYPDRHRAYLLKGETPQTHTQDYHAPPRALEGRKIQIEKQRDLVLKLLKGSDVLEITYEEITNGGDSVSSMPVRPAEKICSFLGVELNRLTTRMVKVAPQVVRVSE